MIRRILITLLGLCITAEVAFAQTCSVPYTLTNGATADATQVMANFNSVADCVSGGAIAGSFTTLNTSGAVSVGATSNPFGIFGVKQATDKWLGVGVPAIATTGVRVMGMNDAGNQAPLELDGTTVNVLSSGSSVGRFSATGLEVTGVLSATSGGSANKAVCWKSGTTLGYCSTAVDSTGSCTCN